MSQFERSIPVTSLRVVDRDNGLFDWCVGLVVCFIGHAVRLAVKTLRYVARVWSAVIATRFEDRRQVVLERGSEAWLMRCVPSCEICNVAVSGTHLRRLAACRWLGGRTYTGVKGRAGADNECKLKGPLGVTQINERKEVPGRVAQVVELVVVVECRCPRLLRLRFRGC